MKRRGIQHHLDGLLALLLFGVFTVCVLSVLLTGARAYRRLTVRDQASYSRRTCAQYITTRVRQADCLGGVTVEPFGDAAALVFTEGIAAKEPVNLLGILVLLAYLIVLTGIGLYFVYKKKNL